MGCDIALPEGKTCKDCGHWPRCSWLIQSLAGTETTCDWSPSRFTSLDAACRCAHPLQVHQTPGTECAAVDEQDKGIDCGCTRFRLAAPFDEVAERLEVTGGP